jgi:hypothetical protein
MACCRCCMEAYFKQGAPQAGRGGRHTRPGRAGDGDAPLRTACCLLNKMLRSIHTNGPRPSAEEVPAPPPRTDTYASAGR